MKGFKYILLIIALFVGQLYSSTDYAICFIHIGDTIPPHVKYAVAQARLFNQDCPIYFLLNKPTRELYGHVFVPFNITFVELESLSLSPEHELFNKQADLNKKYPNRGYWRFVRERFFYLYEFIAQHNMRNVFQLETDVMLYVNIDEILPLFTDHVNPIAATFDNDMRVVPAFIYIRDRVAMQKLVRYFAEHAAEPKNDMNLLGAFKYDPKSCIGHLPIIMEDYARNLPLITSNGRTVKNPSNYFKGSDSIQSIFDAQAIGQYLGGLDHKHRNNAPGFINEACIFNPSLLEFSWEKDSLGRKVPYASYNNKTYRINNIHVHSKKLEEFVS